MRKRWVFSPVWIVCAIRAAIPLSAQTTAAFLGRVLDPSGAAVPGAQVVARNSGTGLKREVRTNAGGDYLMVAMPPGDYDITIEAEGFKTFSHTGVRLEVGENQRVDAAMQLGSASARVDVTGAAPQMDTQSSSVGIVVDNVRVENLPLDGRNVLSLATLVPGVGDVSTPTYVVNQRQGPSVGISGTRSNQSSIMLDGATMANALYNGGVNLPPPDALQEFRILTNTYSAEYGRASGGVLLAITKSGTNQFRGSLWEFLRNDALNARNAFAVSKPVLRRNQFGGSVGGPVRVPGYNGKDRTFFFASYQGIRIGQQGLSTFFPITTPQRGGDFSGIKQALLDPTTRLPFPGNQIPASRFDPMAVQVLQNYIPAANQPDGRSLTAVALPVSGDEYNVKMDHRFSDRDTVNVRYMHRREVNLKDYAGDIYALAASRETRVEGWSAAETHIFSPSMLNEFRASVTSVDSAGDVAPLNKSPRDLGGLFDQDGPTPLAPNITVQGSFTMTATQPPHEGTAVYQFDDKLSWIRGRHSAKFGFSGSSMRHRNRNQFQTSGAFNFDGSFTGNARSDFLIGAPISFIQQSMVNKEEATGNLAGFVQDDFKLHPRFTVNLGVRYELDFPWAERDDAVATVRSGQQSRRIPAAPPGLVYPGDAGVPSGLMNMDWNNVAPRIGFAWDARGNGKTAIRGGYGIFYNVEGAIRTAKSNEVPPFVRVVSLAAPKSLSDPYGGRPAPFPYTPDLANPVYVFPMQIYGSDPGLRTGYVQQFNLNVQRQIGADWALQAGYFGTLGRALLATRETNPARFGPGANAGNAQQRRPYYPQYFAGITTAFSDSLSNYHSLQVSMKKRFARSYTLQLAYTYSKSIDDRSAANMDAASVQDPYNYRNGERGLSDFDRRHMLRINGVWELPRLQSRGWIRYLFGSWRLSGIVSYNSGRPFTATSGRDVAVVGASGGLGAQRPDVAGAASLDPGRSRAELKAQYFNAAAFKLPSAGNFGNSGRNNLIGPGSFNTDTAILKRFPVTKEHPSALEFRCESFNLLNYVNLAQPVSNMNSPGFGRITGAAAARVVQLALRYEF